MPFVLRCYPRAPIPHPSTFGSPSATGSDRARAAGQDGAAGHTAPRVHTSRPSADPAPGTSPPPRPTAPTRGFATRTPHAWGREKAAAAGTGAGPMAEDGDAEVSGGRPPPAARGAGGRVEEPVAPRGPFAAVAAPRPGRRATPCRLPSAAGPGAGGGGAGGAWRGPGRRGAAGERRRRRVSAGRAGPVGPADAPRGNSEGREGGGGRP